MYNKIHKTRGFPNNTKKLDKIRDRFSKLDEK